MKKKSILFALGFFAQITLSLNIAYANPAYLDTQATLCSTASGDEISPHVNVTGYKYIEINGVTYKRLWSYTYARWEDPYWYPA